MKDRTHKSDGLLILCGQGLPSKPGRCGCWSQVACLLLLSDNAKQLNLEAVNAERLWPSNKNSQTHADSVYLYAPSPVRDAIWVEKQFGKQLSAVRYVIMNIYWVKDLCRQNQPENEYYIHGFKLYKQPVCESAFRPYGTFY
jgi:hypothetical protein